MNLTLFLKTARDHRTLMLVLSGAVFVFPVAIIQAFTSMPWDMMEQFLTRMPWISNLIKSLTGADISEMISINALGSFVFVHPVILTVTWASIIAAATRVIAGEIDAGTADLVMALPLSRWQLYISVSAWPVVCCVLMVGCMWIGIWMGDRVADMDHPIDVLSLWRVALNAVVMHSAVVGIAMLCSASATRRGRSTGIVIGILVVSFLLNSLAAFWPKIESVAVFGLLHYFRPFVIVRDSRLEPWNIGVLLSVAVVTWTVGGVIFSRRDIHAV